MTFLLEVYLQHPIQKLNRPFYYRFNGNSISQGVRVLVDFNQQEIIGYVAKVETIQDDDARLQSQSFVVQPIKKIIDQTSIITPELMALVTYFSTRYFIPKIALLHAILPQSLRPSTTGLKGPKIAFEDRLFPSGLTSLPTLTALEHEWYQRLVENESIRKQDIKPPRIAKRLLDLNLARLERVEKYRYRFDDVVIEPKHNLTTQQRAVVDQFFTLNQPVTLLEGVTGSGKTEIYLSLAEHYIHHQQTVLMIVPEIALTPVMVSHVRQRFGAQVAVLHSELTAAEKYDEYRRIADGKVKIVVGARSAIFAPLNKLGLIVIDEEHSETYKQDTFPFYHARDIAIWRGQYHHAQLILGSATPSLETKARAEKKVYGHLLLPHRVNEKPRPLTTIINLSDKNNLSTQSSILSQPLLQAIQKRLEQKQQVILLLNRRGYAGSVVCRSCQTVMLCPTCAIPLAYHKSYHHLQCHFCNHRQPMPRQCPSCNEDGLMKQGFGTQQVEESLTTIFPQARIARLDSDVAKVRTQTATILKKFQELKYDILIGTQMVAKGHDFPAVTLVGIILADLGLSLPHYRASERTFQLISQAIGRTGRGQLDGEAMIQTYMPNHEAITTGARQDYARFFALEMKQRRTMQYPPYTYLVMIELSHKQQVFVDDLALQLLTTLQETLGSQATIIGPNIPYPELFLQWYRRRILIKYKDYEKIYQQLENVVTLFLMKQSIKFTINFDPYDL